MTIISQPGVTVNIVPSQNDVSNVPQRVLFVGQMISGTAIGGELQENILNDNSEDTLFAARAQISGMIREAKKINKETIMDAIGVADAGGGVASIGTIVFAGTATEAGTLEVTIGSKTNHKYKVAVANGDTATDVGDSLATLVAADLDVPGTGANVAGTYTFTAANAGTIGNTIGLRVQGSVAGITHSVTAMTGGATDPTLTNVLDVIGDKRYQTIVWPYADTAALRALLDARFNVSNKVVDGVGIVSITDSVANNLSTLNALNSQSLSVETDKLINETSYKGPYILEIPYIKSSQIGAIRALRRTEGANISRYVIARNGALDSIGGPAISSKPYFNTPMANLPIGDTGKGWNSTELEQIKTAGGFSLGNNVASNGVIMGEVTTTYKTDSAGNPDETFKYLNYVDTSSAAREYFWNSLRSRFAQSRLTQGDLVQGRDMANENSIAAYCTELYSDLSGPDYVLTQSGEDALTFFNEKLSVTINLLTGTATILMSVPIVTQLRTIIATFKIEFSTNS